ncbi:unnamed protein product, partial [Didymodactylos carnosus]
PFNKFAVVPGAPAAEPIIVSPLSAARAAF